MSTGSAEDEEEHEDTEWFFDLFVTYGLGMLRDPTGRPCPQAFLSGCSPGLMNVCIEENQRLLFRIFSSAAAGLSQAKSDDLDKRPKRRK